MDPRDDDRDEFVAKEMERTAKICYMKKMMQLIQVRYFEILFYIN